MSTMRINLREKIGVLYRPYNNNPLQTSFCISIYYGSSITKGINCHCFVFSNTYENVVILMNINYEGISLSRSLLIPEKMCDSYAYDKDSLASME